MSVAVTLEPPPAAQATLPGRRGRWAALPLKAKIGVAILGLYILIAILGPTLAPHDPSATRIAAQATGPSLSHPFGMTSFGQDILSQVLVGIRSTIVLGLLAATIATIFAVLVGVTAGYIGGAVDELLMLITNIFLVLPALPLLIVILGYLPHTGEIPTAIVLSALGWAWGARVIRAQTLALRNRDYVAAARETGERAWRIIAFEIIPNEVSLIAAGFIGVALYAILTSVALAFLGLTDVNSWSIGVILYWAQSQGALELGAWWWWAIPGILVALLGTSLVLINYGLDELGNPSLRETGGRVDDADHAFLRGRGGVVQIIRLRRRRRRTAVTDPTPVAIEAR
jgi:peptide/nickel transport system permease protein